MSTLGTALKAQQVATAIQRSQPREGGDGPPEVGIYLRLSSDPGQDERGVTRQLNRGLADTSDLGWSPVIYVDNDLSATSGVRRDDYERLMADVDAGRLKAVWSWGQDRLCREPGQWEAFMKSAKANGVLFGDRAGVKNLSRASDRFATRNNANASAYEVENMKERQQESFDQMATDGLAFWTRRPFGYTRPIITTFERTPPQIVPEEAALIREAYDAVLNGRSLRSICKEWNDKGFRTPEREVSAESRERNPRMAGRNLWRPEVIRRLLLSPRNAGLRERVRTERINGKMRVVSREIAKDKDGNNAKTEWEAIVDENTWRGTVAFLTSRTRAPDAWSRKYLMSGLAICGNCNGRMTSGGRGRPGSPPCYLCHHCQKVSRGIERVDKYVTTLVVNYLADQEAIERKFAARVDVDKLQARLRELDGIESELGEAMAAGMKFAVIKPQQDAITAERAAIESELTVQPFRHRPLEKLLNADDVAAEFGAMDLDEQRAVVAALFTVVIKPGQPGGRAPFDPAYIEDIET